MDNSAHSIKFGRRCSGLGLVEILIALVLSVLVIAAVIQLFLNNKQAYRLQESLSRIQENGRHALQVLGSDIHMARHLGELQEYWNLTEAASPRNLPSPIGNECFTTAGMPYRWIVPMKTSADHDASGSTPTVFAPSLSGANDTRSPFTGCIPSADYVANTDVISLHFVSATPMADAALQDNQLYVRSDLNHAVVFRCHVAGACAPGGSWDSATVANAPLNAVVYYIRSCSDPGADSSCGTMDDRDQPNLPALVRARLMSDGSVSSEVVAQGVVNMQLQYGVDYGESNFPEQYENANELGALNSAADWPNWNAVKAVRIWLLVRSGISEPGYQDERSYAMGDHQGGSAVNPAASFRHQLFTSTISLRNGPG